MIYHLPDRLGSAFLVAVSEFLQTLINVRSYLIRRRHAILCHIIDKWVSCLKSLFIDDESLHTKTYA